MLANWKGLGLFFQMLQYPEKESRPDILQLNGISLHLQTGGILPKEGEKLVSLKERDFVAKLAEKQGIQLAANS